MQLFYSATSPFAAKVLILAKYLSLVAQIQIISQAVDPTNPEALGSFVQTNPLGKIPALHVPALGMSLYGSQVIVQYLISLADTTQARLVLPEGGAERFKVLTRESLADGLSEALLNMRYETFMRPEEKRWNVWLNGQLSKVTRALNELEHIQQSLTVDAWDLGNIAAFAAIEYIELRFTGVVNWREGRPLLAKWYDFAKINREATKKQ